MKVTQMLLLAFVPACVYVSAAQAEFEQVALPHYTGVLQPTPQRMYGPLVFYPFPAGRFEVAITKAAADRAAEIASALLKRRVAEASAEASSIGRDPDGSIKPLESNYPLEIVLARLAEVEQLEKMYKCNLEAGQEVLRPQGYLIRLRETKGKRHVFAIGYDSVGVFYAAAAILQQIGVEAKHLGVRIGNLDDWPEWRDRFASDYAPMSADAMLALALHRIYGFAIQARHVNWREFGPACRQFSRKPYGVLLDAMQQFKQQTGLVRTMLVLHIYNVSNHDNPRINLADETQIDELIRVCEYAAGKGFDFLVIAVDDYTRYVDGRYVCYHQTEVKKFGDSVGRAHGYLMRRLHDALLKKWPNLRLSFVPATYSTLAHKVNTRPANQRYLRDLAAELPPDVAIVWTGPRVLSSKITRDDYLQYSDYCNAQPMFLWDNSHAFNRPMPMWRTDFYRGFSNDSHSIIFINGHFFAWPWEQVFILTANDYLWNPRDYHPRQSYAQAVRKKYGLQAGKPVLAFRDRMIELSSCEDNPARQQELLLQMAPLLKQMEKQGISTEGPGPRSLMESTRSATDEPVGKLVVPRLSQPPKLDGQLDDACWTEATTFDYQHMQKRKRLYDQTQGRIGYDDQALYLAFTVHYTHPPQEPPKTTLRDSSVYNQSDAIEIFLQRKMELGYGHLVFDIAGHIYDSAHGDPQAKGRDWNPNWKVRVVRDKNAKQWTAEVAIPFVSLSYLIESPPKAGDIWRGNFCRELRLGDSNNIRMSQWSRTFGSFHRPKRFGYLKFE